MILDYAARLGDAVKKLDRELHTSLHFIAPWLTDVQQLSGRAVFGALKAQQRGILPVGMLQRQDRSLSDAGLAAYLFLACAVVV
jgi:hypothetical protein